MEWNNYYYVLNRVKYSRYLLQYASKELRNNYEIVMTAVKNYGDSLIKATPIY